MDPDELKRYLSTMVTDYDKIVIGEYNRKLGFQQGMEKGIQQGLQQGREETVRSMILEMAKNGMSTEQMARISHLAEDQIREILN